MNSRFFHFQHSNEKNPLVTLENENLEKALDVDPDLGVRLLNAALAPYRIQRREPSEADLLNWIKMYLRPLVKKSISELKEPRHIPEGPVIVTGRGPDHWLSQTEKRELEQELAADPESGAAKVYFSVELARYFEDGLSDSDLLSLVQKYLSPTMQSVSDSNPSH